MPNITIDYTANLQDVLRRTELAKKLHQTAQLLNVFPSNGIRTMSRMHEEFYVGNNEQDEAFIQVQVRIAPGRSQTLLKGIAEAFFKTASDALEEDFQNREISLQMEITEFNDELTLRRNTIP